MVTVRIVLLTFAFINFLLLWLYSSRINMLDRTIFVYGSYVERVFNLEAHRQTSAFIHTEEIDWV